MLLSRLIPTLTLTLLLASCGFQLRSATVLPTEMERTYIATDSRHSLFYRTLRARFRDNGVNLVDNPDDPILPLKQAALQEDYKRELFDNHGIVFNELYTLANMPINRFGARLLAKNEYYDYMALLRNSFSAENLDTVMCRNLISVDYQGYVYDCDFNQMLAMPALLNDKPRSHLADLMSSNIEGSLVAIGEHCYGCTAGQGSSCGSALN
ncbi:MAG: DUF3641 domain-containing protein [Proteobacteria bacterium]|nr:DUF3641 domain-containing protein [Pseudomonadota bacterium]